MFTGFQEFDIPTTAGHIHGRVKGTGPPVLLLHGIPETHLMWHHVASELAETFTVVATDLRGYGDSGTPPSAPDHGPYSMREIAREQVEVMVALGHRRFAVVGHDRGARCAYRMALDHSGVVERLAVLDVIPTGDVFRAELGSGFWVWSFLAAPEPVPEQLISGSPGVLVDHMLDSWSSTPGVFSDEVRDAYRAQFQDPKRVHAICEEYRAAATLDREHDENDRGIRKIECPTLVLWGETGGIADGATDPLRVWGKWCDTVTGTALPCGHFLPEEAPRLTTDVLSRFLQA
ncbi:alpha/beta fold hydrolase [Nocardia sp. CDC160]|uniref:alpha/beta fold hydrolase n=1 Tax=Nocardia sp. CDC160 TaxID=3112166 RepID=UPI002DBB82AC|nr:alpha/beta hydrolase [Nocardia sp. CDC160]MEC3916134.1 alpha/beta hydrolase [Nocardia sp. CDC160]